MPDRRIVRRLTGRLLVRERVVEMISDFGEDACSFASADSQARRQLADIQVDFGHAGLTWRT